MAVKKTGADIPLIELYRANIADPATLPTLRFWAAQELKRIEGSFHSVEDALRTLSVNGGGGGGGGGGGSTPVTVSDSATVDLTLTGQNINAEVKPNSIGSDELNVDFGNMNFIHAGWVMGDTYQLDDVVRDGNWTMIANKITTDRPAPIEQGLGRYVYQGTGPAAVSATAKQIIYGTNYTGINDYFIKAYRINVVAGNYYEVVIIHDPAGANEVEWVNGFTATSAGWREFGLVPRPAFAGTQFTLLVIVHQPDPTPVTWTGSWNYAKPTNNTVPTTGKCNHAGNGRDQMWIHKVGDDAIDHGVALLALQTGDIIRVGEMNWSVQSVVDLTTYVKLFVAPAAQASVTGVKLFTFETKAATSITYQKDIGYYTSNPQVQGAFVADGDYGSVVFDDNAYGADIFAQEAYVSPDWDLVAFNSVSTAAGGGESTDITVTTDVTYTVGAGKNFPTLEAALIFIHSQPISVGIPSASGLGRTAIYTLSLDDGTHAPAGVNFNFTDCTAHVRIQSVSGNPAACILGGVGKIFYITSTGGVRFTGVSLVGQLQTDRGSVVAMYNCITASLSAYVYDGYLFLRPSPLTTQAFLSINAQNDSVVECALNNLSIAAGGFLWSIISTIVAGSITMLGGAGGGSQTILATAGKIVCIGACTISGALTALPSVNATYNGIVSLGSLTDTTTSVETNIPVNQLQTNGSAIYIANRAMKMGDVFGPAVAVDSEVARFDGTTGKLIKAGLKYQTSVADRTAGALLAQNAYGMGTAMPNLTADFNDMFVSGHYIVGPGAMTNGPAIYGLFVAMPLFVSADDLTGHVTQIAVADTASAGPVISFRLFSAGVWSAWSEAAASSLVVSTTDVNTGYLKSGFYGIDVTAANTPTGAAGHLITQRSGSGTVIVAELFIVGNIGGTAPAGAASPSPMYLRTRNGAAGNWTPWHKIYDSVGQNVNTSPTGTLGFATGAGGTITQGGTKNGTAVTNNKPTGNIITAADALGSLAYATFTLNNTQIAANDTVHACVAGPSAAYVANATYVRAGACSIVLQNISAGALSEAVTINFVVIKGAIA